MNKTKHPFTLDGIRPFNNRKGVYAIGYKDEIFYVGQSKNLGDRLRHHRSENAFENTIRDIIRKDGQTHQCKALAMYHFINTNRKDIYFMILAEVEDLLELDVYEEKYITELQPRYNYTGVDVPYKGPHRKLLENFKND